MKKNNDMRYEVSNLSSQYSNNQVFEGMKWLKEKIGKFWFKELYAEDRRCLSIWCMSLFLQLLNLYSQSDRYSQLNSINFNEYNKIFHLP